MSNSYQVSKEFKDMIMIDLPLGEYDDCIFRNCNFSEGDLSGYIFSECEFIECDLSNMKLTDCAFRDVHFKSCKMIGLQFDDCNTFSLSFRFSECILDYSSFYKLKLKKTGFDTCRMTEVDFSGTVLTGSSFHNCDLSGAIFQRSNLEKADFRTATNFSINPEQNSIRNARFSVPGLVGLLHKYHIVVD
ncbi:MULTISPECIES: pentapeptide repeat-containing protein [unclassified Saccharicrinis]|uniref:pentapeptide repeat-containing protein n=1 Tax=unclassified Saccharicrinis TaxID=2646859 RepID=UPI003D353FC0